MFLAVVVMTPVLIALGLLDNALAQASPANQLQAYFDLKNPSLWTGLVVLSLVGLVTLIRGLGYPLGGLKNSHGNT